MGKADFYKSGDNNAICTSCGFKFKASKLKTDQYGNIVCNRCYDPRHPQEFVRSKVDKQSVNLSNPDTEPVFTAEALLLTPVP